MDLPSGPTPRCVGPDGAYGVLRLLVAVSCSDWDGRGCFLPGGSVPYPEDLAVTVHGAYAGAAAD
ncbi:hypothetical protein Sros01_31740 [Streptomyces roseochromogenus]|nr:hypothetical protein Sros01_31740 [Streptomyces roseochromogenus]